MTNDRYDITKLDWQPWHTGGERSVVNFDNGYSASCLKGGMFYTDGGTYEIAVMKDGKIVYDTPIAEDVLGYLSEDEANQALMDISNLEAKGGA